MCMLCVVPPNVLPSKDKLIASALNNPHGFGFAIVVPQDKYIISERSMNADESINRFLELRARYPEGYALWHARYATHGSNTVENCHPFAVGGDPSTYLAHNGILPVLEYENMDWSDTRIFAEDILPQMGGVKALDNPQLLNMIEDFTTGSKLCVLTVDPVAEHQCYIVHEEKGWKDDTGVWWSNTTCYLPEPTRKSGYSSWGYMDDYTGWSTKDAKAEEYDTCLGCEAIIDYWELEKTGMVCDFCGTCNDCGHFVDRCHCEYYKYERANANKWWSDHIETPPKRIHSVAQSELLEF